MATVRGTFKGLNTDQSPNKVASGTADVATNVILDAGSLKRRRGFSEYEDDVSGSALSVVSIYTARFANGYVYIVCKCSNGTLYRRMVYPVSASAFTAISGGATHSGSDVGWWYVWADRLYHFDRGGGSKWNPQVNSGTAYKAGIPRPAVGPIPFPAAGGEKEGYYHVWMAYRNSLTREEGVVSGTHTPYIETRLSESKGGLVIDNWSDTSVAAALARDGTVVGGAQINESDSTYEWDQAVFYTSQGNTEYIGLGSGAEAFSYRANVDEVVAKTQTTVGLNKSDECLDQRQPIVNTGGEPPKAAIGCFTGSRGIYAGIYASGHATLTTSQAARDADLTFQAVASGTGGNSITVQYTTGGTAGAEVVAVNGNDITVQIETGVSTAQQVLTALHGTAAATALVTVKLAKWQSGSGVVVVNGAPLSLSGGAATGTNSMTPGTFRYSIAGQPCMVPARVSYSTGGDGKTFEPQPWVGECNIGGSGEVTAAGYGAGTAALFTATAAYAIRPAGNGQLVLQEIHPAKGCVSDGAACGSARGVHALGDKSWLVMGGGATQDLAEDVFSTTISDIPASRRNLGRMGWYAFQDQVWAAVSGPVSGGVTPKAARRILVWDEASGGNLIAFDLAAFSVVGVCTGSSYTEGKTTITATAAKFKSGMVGYTMVAGGSNWTITDYTNTTTIKVSGDATALSGASFSIDWDEGITGLCELAYPGVEPYMLACTNRGRILKYPDTDLDDGKGFTSQWRGYFGQERIGDDQRIAHIDMHTGGNVASVVKVYLRAIQTGGASDGTDNQKGPVTLAKDNGVHKCGSEYDRIDGSLFQLDITSDAATTAQWEIADVVMKLVKRNS